MKHWSEQSQAELICTLSGAYSRARMAVLEWDGKRQSFGYAWAALVDDNAIKALQTAGADVLGRTIYNPGNGSMRNESEAGAEAFCEALRECGIPCFAEGRLD